MLFYIVQIDHNEGINRLTFVQVSQEVSLLQKREK